MREGVLRETVGRHGRLLPSCGSVRDIVDDPRMRRPGAGRSITPVTLHVWAVCVLCGQPAPTLASLSHPSRIIGLQGEAQPIREATSAQGRPAAPSDALEWELAQTVIYLDYNATTPVDEGVLASMLPWMTDRFWNAASSHAGGRSAAESVERARDQVAELIGARRGEIVWTSGATEANNLALKGAIEASPSTRSRLVTVATEHKAVLDVASWLDDRGAQVTVLPVAKDGGVESDRLVAQLERDDVALVSVMAANNETGVVSDLRAIAHVVHEHGALLHTDATQIVGKLAFDVAELDVDLASMSAHKVYGPKGVGALYISRRVPVAPLIHGGGHERGLRSGTINVPGVIGFGVAAELAGAFIASGESERQRELVRHLVNELKSRVDDLDVVQSGASGLPNTVNVRIAGADAEAVMANAPAVLVSSGSACTSLTPSPSHVLLAMGFDRAAAAECLRFSVGRPTTEADITEAVRELASAVDRVRSLLR